MVLMRLRRWVRSLRLLLRLRRRVRVPRPLRLCTRRRAALVPLRWPMDVVRLLLLSAVAVSPVLGRRLIRLSG